MEARRILILCGPGLLAQGLRSLLEVDNRLQVQTADGDPRKAAALIREWKPDVLVVAEQDFPLGLGVPPDVLPLGTVSTVVALRENDNTIRIYRLEELTPSAPQELNQILTA